MTEALICFLDIFRHMRQDSITIKASVGIWNMRGQAVLARCGFTRQGLVGIRYVPTSTEVRLMNRLKHDWIPENKTRFQRLSFDEEAGLKNSCWKFHAKCLQLEREFRINCVVQYQYQQPL
jgi:hypothetical protein